jgi:hypothetical protein
MNDISDVYDALTEEVNAAEENRRHLEERYNETGAEQFAAQATRERGRLEGLREARDWVAALDFAKDVSAGECPNCGETEHLTADGENRICWECGKRWSA